MNARTTDTVSAWLSAIERRFQLATRLDIPVAAEADGGLANVLDQLEGLFAFLLAQRVAEQTPEQPDVLLEREILVEVAWTRSVLFIALPSSVVGKGWTMSGWLTLSPWQRLISFTRASDLTHRTGCSL